MFVDLAKHEQLVVQLSLEVSLLDGWPQRDERVEELRIHGLIFLNMIICVFGLDLLKELLDRVVFLVFVLGDTIIKV